MSQTSQSTAVLYQAYQQLRQEQPKWRARQLAAQLKISEAELVAIRQGKESQRLNDEFAAMFAAFPSLGNVMALTRNEQAVHERHGRYHAAHFDSPQVGVVLGPQIDLRLFMRHWQSGFWLIENGRESLQFFDEFGEAVHKIYRTEKTDGEAWQQFIEQFKASDDVELTIHPQEPKVAETLPENFDAAQFAKDWSELNEIHEYHGMLKRYQISRTHALEQIGSAWAVALPNTALQTLLEQSRDQHCPLIIFVGNRGCIQIHTGEPENVKVVGPWLNILDPEFNLHLNVTEIASCWAIKRPTEDGFIHSVECFNRQGDTIATFFGKRKPGQKELPVWTQLVGSLWQMASQEVL
ncbi:hemin-degrading factor [Celerinatantimonas sp. YJH-8]|uniref:hemin-degrading factor n=1 Tax=Celerinatantimonas sp. YJH-8 TaxID=3228714 RepID=UPI0038C45222